MSDLSPKLPILQDSWRDDPMFKAWAEKGGEVVWELTRWRLDDRGIFCVDRITEKPINEKTYRDCALYQDDNRIVCKLAGVDFGFLILVRL